VGGASQTRVSLIVIASFFVHPQGVIRSGCVNIFKRLAPIGAACPFRVRVSKNFGFQCFIPGAIMSGPIGCMIRTHP